MEFLRQLKQFFDDFSKPQAEPIRLDEIPNGMDSLEAIILGNYYESAFNKGLFSETDSERLKTMLRNQKLHHGETVFSEERIEATIACMHEACNDFSTIVKHTDHAKTKARVAEVPEIWRR